LIGDLSLFLCLICTDLTFNFLLLFIVIHLKEEFENLTFENEKKVHQMRQKESETYKVMLINAACVLIYVEICPYLYVHLLYTSDSSPYISKNMKNKLTLRIHMNL
jgi:hypothetical protein